jgi:hypothetical protein
MAESPTLQAPAMIRQGDVLLVPVGEVPQAARRVARSGGRVVLAWGEVTGHAHAISAGGATLLEQGTQRYLRVTRPVVLAHEEHAAIGIAPGAYRVVIQREYVPAESPAQAWRRVVD